MTIMGRQICSEGDGSGDVVDQRWFLFESDKTRAREAEMLCSDAVAGGLVGGQVAGEAAKARDNATGLSVGIGQGSTKWELLLSGAALRSQVELY